MDFFRSLDSSQVINNILEKMMISHHRLDRHCWTPSSYRAHLKADLVQALTPSTIAWVKAIKLLRFRVWDNKILNKLMAAKMFNHKIIAEVADRNGLLTRIKQFTQWISKTKTCQTWMLDTPKGVILAVPLETRTTMTMNRSSQVVRTFRIQQASRIILHKVIWPEKFSTF